MINPNNKLNLIGKKYGKWTVLQLAKIKKGRTQWLCRCECGREFIISADTLRNGRSTKCKCCSNKEKAGKGSLKHGYAPKYKKKKSIYNIWKSMMQRCYDQNSTSYKNYGDRGIKVCERWHNFENFLKDMGEKPEGMSLERVNNNGNYEPDNCRWATKKEQANNTRRNKHYEFNGEIKTASQWAYVLGITYNQFRFHVNRLGIQGIIDNLGCIKKNSRQKLFYSYKGINKSLSDWSQELLLDKSNLFRSINYWGFEVYLEFRLFPKLKKNILNIFKFRIKQMQ